MTSIHIIIFFVGYVTGKTSAVCDQMPELTATMTEIWGEQVNASCLDTGIPFQRPVARP